jgi:hypothetical protein
VPINLQDENEPTTDTTAAESLKIYGKFLNFLFPCIFDRSEQLCFICYDQASGGKWAAIAAALMAADWMGMNQTSSTPFSETDVTLR